MPLQATLRTRQDLTPLAYEIKGKTSRLSEIDTAIEVTVPKLNEMAYEQVELAGVPFSDYIANKHANGQPANNSLVLRGYVRTWLRHISDEYDRVGLLDRLTDRQAAAA